MSRVLQPSNSLESSGKSQQQNRMKAQWVVEEIRRAVRDFNSVKQANKRVLEYSGEFDIGTKSELVINGRVPGILAWNRGKCIGSGSSGSIYHGQSVSGNVFAAKQIPLDESQSSFSLIPDQLRIEVHALSCGKGHPNIVNFEGAEIIESSLFIYMEYSPSHCALSQLVASRGPMPESFLVSIAAQVLEALTFLHSYGVIHRDVKASNVLIDPSSGQCKLCDFGSACIRDSLEKFARPYGDLALIPCIIERESDDFEDDSWAEGVRGTCNWMAPEVMQGVMYNSNVDCWSLGCMLIEIGTGKLPWKEFDNQIAATFSILQSDKTAYDLVDRKVSSGWSSLCRNFLKSALIRDPRMRWSSERLRCHPWIYLPN